MSTKRGDSKMNEKDAGILPENIIKGLSDKLYEKRKAAAVEIERMVKEYVSASNYQPIQTIISTLGRDFANASTAQPRNGGLIALAACSLGLGTECHRYIELLIEPALHCFRDSDNRTRYYACESLYNTCKVARASSLILFNEIFDGLSILADDSDQSVRSGGELLDRLMKDIVTESSEFNLPAFIPILKKRIVVVKPFCRRFVVSWVSVLCTIPNGDVLVFLPELLDGLFIILEDGNRETSFMSEKVLDELMQMIEMRCKDGKGDVDFPSMSNTLLLHSISKAERTQRYALSWLRDFLTLSNRKMLPFAAGLIGAALPCLSYDEYLQSTRKLAMDVNTRLRALLTADLDVPGTAQSETDSAGGAAKFSVGQDENKMEEDGDDSQRNLERLELNEVISCLTEILVKLHNKMTTKIAALEWLLLLFRTIPNSTFHYVKELSPLILKLLSDDSDEVVLANLQLIAEISSNAAGSSYSPPQPLLPPSDDSYQQLMKEAGVNQYFVFFARQTLGIFSTDSALLKNKGSFVIRQLCLYLDAERVYRSLAAILEQEEDLPFACSMVQTLSTILLSSRELADLRLLLKSTDSKEGVSLFRCLYKSWCSNPVAAVSLCLFTENYHLSYALLRKFADIDVTVDLFSEIDRLVQLIESPVFLPLRLQLLDADRNAMLVRALYCLLMILPQSEAYHTLLRRLDCVPRLLLLQSVTGDQGVSSSPPAAKGKTSKSSAKSSKDSSQPPSSHGILGEEELHIFLDVFATTQRKHRGIVRESFKHSS